MPLDDITDFVGDALGSDATDIALDLIPDSAGGKRRRRSGSLWFWALLLVMVIAVFWFVFTL